MSVLRTVFRSRFSNTQEKNNEKIINIINNSGGQCRLFRGVRSGAKYAAEQTAGSEPHGRSVAEPVNQPDAFADRLAKTGFVPR